MKNRKFEFIPVNEPLFDGRELEYLTQCVQSGWVSSEGSFVQQFEQELSARTTRRFGISVSSGTAALEVAVAALGLENGDEVILPTHTIISCVSALVRRNVKPVLVDTDLATWNMDVGKVESAITSRTRAIMVVHTFGLPVDMDPIIELAKKYSLMIIEDAAQATGLTYKGRPCGSFGNISTFSFYPNKHITTGEGGMILCDDPLLAKRSRSYRNLCFQESKRFVHEELGWNYRMSNLHAAVGMAQLETLPEHLQQKRSNGLYYKELLAGTPGLILPPNDKPYSNNYFWVFGILLGKELDVSAVTVMAKLKERGIGTRPFFWPMHEQPVFQRMNLFNNESYPVAELFGRRGFYIPSGLTLTRQQQQRIVETLVELLRIN